MFDNATLLHILHMENAWPRLADRCSVEAIDVFGSAFFVNAICSIPASGMHQLEDVSYDAFAKGHEPMLL